MTVHRIRLGMRRAPLTDQKTIALILQAPVAAIRLMYSEKL